MAETSVGYDSGGDPDKNEVKDESIASTTDTQSKEFKVILLGMNGVGKTSLFLRIKDDRFYEDTRNIRTTDQGIKKTIQVGQRQVEMTLYDSAAGMEYHERTLSKGYYRDSCIALLVYSADSIDSVTRLVQCIARLKEYAPEAKYIVIRNKVDLEDQTVKEYEVSAKITGEGYELSKTIEHFCSTSALNGSGIKELLLKIGKIIVERMKSSTNEAQLNRFDSFRPNQEAQPTETSQSRCC